MKKINLNKILMIMLLPAIMLTGCKKKAVKVENISFNSGSTAVTIIEGNSATLEFTITPADAANKNVTWKSSDETIATILNGVITAKKAGTATITVTTADGNKSATCTVTVNAATVAPTFTTQPANASVTAGGNATFTAAANGTPAPTLKWQQSTDGATWTDISGATNATLTLNAVTVAMSGNKYRCVATNSAGAANSNAATLTVTPPPTYIISASTITSFGSLTAGYSQPAAKTVTVTNSGTGEVTLTQPTATNYEIGALSATTLAAGATATFTVRPKAGLAVGTYNETITINGTNGAKATVSAAFTVTPALPPAPVITTATGALTGGTTDLPYSVTLAATNSPTSWTVSSGSLPAGLTLNNSGVISGTPTSAGTANFTVTATNAGGTSAQVAFSIVITLAVPVITTPAGDLTGGFLGVPYSVTLTATNSPTSWAWSGTPPPGLTLSNSGVISGTPTGTAPSWDFTVTATNAGGTSAPVAFGITITLPPAPVITTAAGALTDGTGGTAYSVTLAATNSPTSWAVSSGSLPAGLTLNTSTGEISGTPTTPVTRYFSITATNAGGTSAPVAFSILINPAAGAPVITTTSPLPDATVGTYYSFTLAATNSPTSWTAINLVSAGLSFNTTTGEIYGTTAVVPGGPHQINVTASNAAGTSVSVPLLITIKAIAGAPEITVGAVPNGNVGVAYTLTLSATNSPTSWSASNLPAGLSINNSGVISGTPTESANSYVRVWATNATGTSNQATFYILIQP